MFGWNNQIVRGSNNFTIIFFYIRFRRVLFVTFIYNIIFFYRNKNQVTNILLLYWTLVRSNELIIFNKSQKISLTCCCLYSKYFCRINIFFFFFWRHRERAIVVMSWFIQHSFFMNQAILMLNWIVHRFYECYDFVCGTVKVSRRLFCNVFNLASISM